MKIVHLCLACFFPDGYSYQENLLPKFHKKMGFDVEVIASLLTFGPNGESAYMEPCPPYLNENDIKVTRLNYASEGRVSKKLQLFEGLEESLDESNPDILFIHGCQFLDMRHVVNYLNRNRNVTVFVDNHADYSNSATNFLSKAVLHRMVWKHTAKLIEPYTEKFWGVLPARVDFLQENYGLPKEKCALLVMGADDGEVKRATSGGMASEVRASCNVGHSDFLIVTGGKIDGSKRQTLELMKAVKALGGKVKLLVFGPVSKDIKPTFDEMFDPQCMCYVPWANASQSYDYFAAADLVVFPGRHSVYWEQVAALGKPMIVKRWDGANHVDCGGNLLYTSGDDFVSLKNDILFVVEDSSRYESMLNAAKKSANLFLYSEIAKKSVNCKALSVPVNQGTA